MKRNFLENARLGMTNTIKIWVQGCRLQTLLGGNLWIWFSVHFSWCQDLISAKCGISSILKIAPITKVSFFKISRPKEEFAYFFVYKLYSPQLEIWIVHSVGETFTANTDTFKYTVTSELMHDKLGIDETSLFQFVGDDATDEMRMC